MILNVIFIPSMLDNSKDIYVERICGCDCIERKGESLLTVPNMCGKIGVHKAYELAPQTSKMCKYKYHTEMKKMHDEN